MIQGSGMGVYEGNNYLRMEFIARYYIRQDDMQRENTDH